MGESITKRLIEAGFLKPEQGLIALIAAQAAFWTLAPALSHSAPPLDVVEMYAWGREGVVATFKHPNLPGLVLEGVRRVTGVAGWPAYLVSQIFVALTLFAVFALGKELMDGRRALAGALLLTGVVFFSWPTPEFNHNVAQMPFWAFAMLMLWRLTSTKSRLAHWALFGLVCGFSLWAKYSSGVLLLVCAVWMLWDSRARRTLATPGPYLALVTFAASAAPQVLFLIDSHFQPFAYAARRSAHEASVFAPFEFALTQALNHLPMLIVLACAGLFGAPAADAPPSPEKRAMRFLWLMGAGPLAFTTLAALIGGAGLKTAWAAPMLNLSGLLAVALLSTRVTQARLNRVAWGASVLIVLVSSLYFAHMRYGALFTDKPLRGNWPQARISRAIEDAWAREHPGAPLRIVAGDIWTAGLIGMSDPHPPSVLINGDYAISPWVTRADVAQGGAIIVWKDGAPPPISLDDTRAQAHVIVPFAQFPKAPPLRINWVELTPDDEINLNADKQ